MGQGVSLLMSMKFARHKPGSMRVHLVYGQLTCMDVFRAVSCASPTQPVSPVTAQGPCPGGVLNGVSLKHLVEWHEGGKLTAQEFACAKKAHAGVLIRGTAEQLVDSAMEKWMRR